MRDYKICIEEDNIQDFISKHNIDKRRYVPHHPLHIKQDLKNGLPTSTKISDRDIKTAPATGPNII